MPIGLIRVAGHLHGRQRNRPLLNSAAHTVGCRASTAASLAVASAGTLGLMSEPWDGPVPSMFAARYGSPSPAPLQAVRTPAITVQTIALSALRSRTPGHPMP
jgi:hypothetical protein